MIKLNNKKKICFVTGSRAEYGLLRPLMSLVQEHLQFEIQIIATGMHLSPEFGLTYRQIESDGFTIDEKVEVLLSSDTSSSMVKSTGMGLLFFPDSLTRLAPDMVIVLGDRYEIFSATIAAYFLKIPIAHLHGGETTEGAVDEAIRHSITKMATFHFTSTEQYRKRIIQLGEHPSKVYHVGAIGIDGIMTLNLLSREKLFKSLEVLDDNQFFLITYHPVTLSLVPEEELMKELFKALDDFPEVSLIFTMPNADAGGRKIIMAIKEYVLQRSNAHAYTSLGQLRYLSAAKEAVAVIGNSSSGIIEVPSLKTPTVNIGARQKGRVSSKSVINCSERSEDIMLAIKESMSKKHKKVCQSVENPYGKGDVAKQITKVIEREPEYFHQKSFQDVEFLL